MEQQLTFDFLAADQFLQYHRTNPQIYREFKRMALATIAKGFKHYSAKGIFEIIRWHTGVQGSDGFKVNNNYTPYYARLFEKEHPQYKGFFFTRESKFDTI